MCGRVIQLERGKPQNIIPAATDVTTTSKSLRASGHNAIIIYSYITGSGSWAVKLRGSSEFGGTHIDTYDHNGEILSTGAMSTSRGQLFVGIPENFQILAEEMVDGATIKVDFELLTV